MWRNEQRNLEAEARVLVEQLRDLVASNATSLSLSLSLSPTGESLFSLFIV
jgi:hypothetical protein